MGPYPIGGTQPSEGGLFPLKILWVAAPQYAGPALVRARRLDGPGIVRFAQGDAAPQDELQLLDSAVTPTDGWRQWPSYTLVPGPGCYAYQVDGADFSYAIVLLVTA